MSIVVHETPGLLDMAAITTFGVHAKPNTTNPIGHFGTGLKYAIAVLCREGARVTVFLGEEPHIFYGEKMVFRDREMLRIKMRRQRGVTARWMAQELPFTTELGKNWELWMALRELHSNTLDEGGNSFIATEAKAPVGEPNTTRIVVEHEAYAMKFDEIGSVFLQEADSAAAQQGVQCVPRENKYVFYRGLRAYTMPRRTKMTWCFWSTLVLTEDRTLRDFYMLDYMVVRFLCASRDEKLLRTVMTATDDYWEAHLPWDSWEFPVSPEFIAMARLYGPRRAKILVIREDNKARAKGTILTEDWREVVLASLETAQEELITPRVMQYRPALVSLLKHDLKEHPPKKVVAEQDDENDIPY